MSNLPKRYIKIEKEGKTFVLDTHTEMMIEIEDSCVWLNYEWKEREFAEKRLDEHWKRHEQEMRELREERTAELLRRATA